MQSDHELDCILAKTDDYRLYYAQESERKRFFNRITPKIPPFIEKSFC